MFKKGSLIVYGNNGVCTVEDITTVEGSGDRLYYVLKNAAKNGGTAYVPVDSPVYMRPVMSEDGARELINKIPEIRTSKFENISIREAQKVYREALSSHSPEQIIALIKHIKSTAERKRKSGKKLSATEERFLEQALNIIEGELIVSLNVSLAQLHEMMAKVTKQEG